MPYGSLDVRSRRLVAFIVSTSKQSVLPATMEVHHFFSRLSSIWELKTSQALIWREIKLLLLITIPDEKSHDLS